MNYIGSKFKLLDFLETSIKSVVGDEPTIFCDAFAGTGTVGAHFKRKGYSVISNDLQYYSYVMIRHFIQNNIDLTFSGLIGEFSNKEDIFNYLNNLPLEEGFIFNNYSSGGTQTQEFQRTYFSDENAKICDTTRKKIEGWKESNKINQDEYFYLLACLIEATDKKANTASVYGAFLKELKKTAKEKIIIKPLEIIESDKPNMVFNQDINTLLKNIETTVMYFDPPYNTRVYGDNYHILETIAKYDNPEIKGKTGNRVEKVKSNYSSKRQVKKAFLDLIKNCNAKYIFLSYNNEGLLSLEEIKEIMSTRGEYGLFQRDYQRFKADKTKNRKHKADKTIEYLHYVVVNK